MRQKKDNFRTFFSKLLSIKVKFVCALSHKTDKTIPPLKDLIFQKVREIQ